MRFAAALRTADTKIPENQMEEGSTDHSDKAEEPAEKDPAKQEKTEPAETPVEKESVPASGSSQQEKPAGQPSAPTEQPSAPAEQPSAPAEQPSAPAEQPPAPEEQPTEPLEPPEPEFDVDYWVSYAKGYAESIGLQLDSTATACWDNPISANAKRTGIESDIVSRLNRYKNVEGFTAVWIWAEKVSDTDYEIYIGYA